MISSFSTAIGKRFWNEDLFIQGKQFCKKIKIAALEMCFHCRFASEIESDPVGQYTRAREVLQELEIAPDTVNDEDLSSLR